jgi:CheY-like chemotaxis protein
VTVVDAMPVTLALRVALDNAVRYTSGPIKVALYLSDGSVAVTVRDIGSGMTADELEEVGKRFYRGDQSIGTPGAGLGIHLARTVLEAAGGTFSIESGSEGTTVLISLPLPATPDTPRSDQSGIVTVLCIEDDPHLREDLVHELREAGYAVIEAADGQSGLEIIRKGGVSLVYCDVQLPGMDGFELLEQMSLLLEVDVRPPVVLLTAFGDSQSRHRAVELGAKGLLVKPVDYAELLQLTRQVTGS